MWTDVANNFVALLVGLLTGFFFERRATKSAREQNEATEARNRDLAEELRRTRLEMTGRVAQGREPLRPPRSAVSHEEVLTYILQYQDAAGRLRLSSLKVGLAGSGQSPADIDAAVAALASSNRVRLVGNEIEVTS